MLNEHYAKILLYGSMNLLMPSSATPSQFAKNILAIFDVTRVCKSVPIKMLHNEDVFRNTLNY